VSLNYMSTKLGQVQPELGNTREASYRGRSCALSDFLRLRVILTNAQSGRAALRD
jgi:hypothetical protein